MVSIKNEYITASIFLKGAEVVSVINNATNHNYYWDKNPDIWNNTSPVLFPVVGKSNNNEIRFQGKKYPLTNHGFARHKTFKAEFLSESEVSLTLSSNDLGESEFPFRFIFTVNFKLIDKKLITTYSVENPSSGDVFFSVGAHPAFRCPFDSAHSLDDYYLQFSDPCDDTLTLHEITSEATYTSRTSPLKLENARIDFKHFDVTSTPVFSGFKSKSVALIEKDSGRKIVCSIENFPYVAFWKKADANFLCIEPWCGKSDDADFHGEFNKKKDIIALNGGKTWSVSYDTTFDY